MYPPYLVSCCVSSGLCATATCWSVCPYVDVCVACTHPTSCPAVSSGLCATATCWSVSHRPSLSSVKASAPLWPPSYQTGQCFRQYVGVCVFAGVMVSVFVSMFVGVSVRVLLVILKECSSVCKCVVQYVSLCRFVSVLFSVLVWAFVNVLASVSVGVCAGQFAVRVAVVYYQLI